MKTTTLFFCAALPLSSGCEKKADSEAAKASSGAQTDEKPADKTPAAPKDKPAPALAGAKNTNAAGEAAAPLRTALEAKKAAFLKKAPQATIDAYEAGLDELRTQGIAERAAKKGDRAPDFTLPNATGTPVALSKLLEKGPVVVAWYRGAWCPYCNIQLRHLQKVLPEFKAAGATLVAISPQSPDKSLTSQQKGSLQFEVLSDAGGKVATAYGLLYPLPAGVLEKFKGRIDVAAHNADGSNNLPLTATYVIGKDGTIAWSFVDVDYRKRAEPADILAAVKAL